MFPDEIWFNIFNNFNGRDITIMSMTSKNFNKLISDSNIINKIKFRGFPRKEGQCKIHDISTIEENITTLSKYLYDNNYDLVRGDFIYVGDKIPGYEKIYVFDGVKLLNLLKHRFFHNYRMVLPKDFIIDNDNIPIDYWYKSNEYFRESYGASIMTRINFGYVWIDHNLIKVNSIDLNYDRKIIEFTINNNIYILGNYTKKLIDENEFFIYQFLDFNDNIIKYYVHEFEPPKEEVKTEYSCSIM